MSLTPSKMLPLGAIAPNFSLPDVVSRKTLSLASLKSEKATVVMFICNHCPFVQHIISKLVEVVKLYQDKGVAFIAINSNNVENYQQDSPDNMRENAVALGFTFPYLYDESQAVAKAYDAACTPDFFIFNNHMACVYRGRFDEATPGKMNLLLPIRSPRWVAILNGSNSPHYLIIISRRNLWLCDILLQRQFHRPLLGDGLG
jgi:thiol-disulfide isomerase/thioredoxin